MKKLYRQNILDFLITYYGTIDALGQFMAENNMNNIEDFYYMDKFVVSNKIVNNEVLINNIKVVTGLANTLPEPDFNDDFNEDFLT